MERLKPIQYAADYEFKEGFIERYSRLTDFNEFKKYSLSYLRKAIRVNTLKISVEELKARLEDDWELEQVPWCNEGFWIEHKGEEKRRDVGNLPEHLLGYIYIQEPASMIPPLVLDPKPGDIVLDMCAAPGSKTTQIAQYMKNEGTLIANELTGARIASLGINTQRCGLRNCMITNMPGHRFAKAGIQFDKILVDAPCSGTGTIRKSLKTIQMWNPNMVRKIAGTQRQLIRAAFEILKPGGTMVYSTCTLEPEENEEIIDGMIQKYDDFKLEKIDIKIKSSPAVTEFEGKSYSPEVKKCLRIWPQDNDTEGFFVAKIKKEEKK